MFAGPRDCLFSHLLSADSSFEMFFSATGKCPPDNQRIINLLVNL